MITLALAYTIFQKMKNKNDLQSGMFHWTIKYVIPSCEWVWDDANAINTYTNWCEWEMLWDIQWLRINKWKWMDDYELIVKQNKFRNIENVNKAFAKMFSFFFFFFWRQQLNT